MATGPITAASATPGGTPLLDLEEPLPKLRRWKYWTFFALFVSFPVIVGFFQDWAADNERFAALSSSLDIGLKTIFGITMPPDSAPQWLWFATPLVIIAMAYPVVAVHEAGHACAGILSGLRFNFVMLWPFRVSRERNRFVIRREKTLCIYCGATSMHPERWERVRLPLLVYVLGGPAANLLSFVCLNAFIPRTEAAPSYFLFLAAVFANLSLLIGAVNLLPFRVGAMESDGARVLMIAAARPRFERWLALLRLNAATTAGIRSRDSDPVALQKATALLDNSGDCFRAHLFAYSNAVDREHAGDAGYHLERCLRWAGRLNTIARAHLMFTSAIFHGWYKEDAVRAKRWFDMAGKPGQRLARAVPFWGIYPQIAIFWAEGKHAEAFAKMSDAIAAIEKLPDTPVRDLLLTDARGWREKMEQRLRERAAPTPA